MATYGQLLEDVRLTAKRLAYSGVQAGEDVGLATVYRVLTQFESAGLVIRRQHQPIQRQHDRDRKSVV